MKWNHTACVMVVGVVIAGICGGASGVSCTTGRLCTRCYGYYVTINGQIYCGNFTNGGTTSCSVAGSGAAYKMSPCCDSSYHAVGEPTGCYVVSCNDLHGMVISDDKTSCLCAVGYYGNASTGCTRCPALDGVNGTTSGSNKSSITDCFIPANTKMTDSSGHTYKFYNKNCHYTK